MPRPSKRAKQSRQAAVARYNKKGEADSDDSAGIAAIDPTVSPSTAAVGPPKQIDDWLKEIDWNSEEIEKKIKSLPVIGRNAPGNSRSYSFKQKAKKNADAKATEGSSKLESFGFYVKRSDAIEKEVSEKLLKW